MMTQDFLSAKKGLVVVLCPDAGDKNFMTSTQLAHLITSRVTALITVCSWYPSVYPQLTIRETIYLAASLGSVWKPDARQRALLRMLPLDMQCKVEALPALQRRYLALIVALVPMPDCAILVEPTQGLSYEATNNWRRGLQRVRTLVDTPMLYVTADLETIHTLNPDEIRWFQDGEYRQVWPVDAPPAILRRGAAYHLTFHGAQAALDLQNKLQAHAPDFGVLSYEKVDSTQAVIVVDAPSRLLSLTLLAGQALVRVDRKSINLKMLNEQIRAQIFDMDGWPVTCALASSAMRLPTRPHLAHMQVQSIWHLGMAEWRRHFRTFWRIGNILFSNILLLGFLSILLQVLQQGAVKLAANLMALTLVAASGLAMGWGLINIGRFVPERTTALGFLTGVGTVTFWSGLIGGQLLILITHTLLLGVLWLTIFSRAGVLLFSFLYFLFTLLGALGLTVLATLLVTGQTARLIVGWGLYLTTLFMVAITHQIPDRWQLSLALWPFTGLTLAFTELTTTSARPTDVPAEGWLALAGLVGLWGVTAVIWTRKRRAQHG